MLLEPGRLCIKKLGRDAGSRAVITKIEGNGYVQVLTATRHKRERRCNTAHLELLGETVDVKNSEAVAKALGIKSL
ncbi:MAG: 50S ribosomal protein L14e [Candidatus Marsarchaeota archaeon]|jgi:ribosomal protein L14E/L6E/L27E|nr:50S ribosomal protein L14e [Candidatus Marsarchaeota archaeon]